MASKGTFLFSQPDLVTCSFSMFYDMKKKGELSDVSVRIDNRVFTAHRVILAAAIPYFRTMFTSNLAESREKEVTMKGLDPVALEFLIDFAYTSKVTITIENVQSLLVASEYLQLTQVRDSCADFLSKRLDPSNVMNVRNLAESQNCGSLVKNADTYIWKNFEAFSQTKEFLSLPFSFLNDLIRKDELQVSSEEIVFDAVMKWVKIDDKRHRLLSNLLTGVRLIFLTPQVLVKKASKEKLIMDSAPCRNLLDEAKNYHLLPEEGASSCSFTVSERGYGQSAGCGIYLFCCNRTRGLTIYKYSDAIKKWSTVLSADKRRSDLQRVLVLGDEIYVFRSNTFESFNPRTLKWTARGTLPSTHSSFKNVISCNGKIYWLGNPPNSCQGLYFDDNRNQWVRYTHQNVCIYSDDELVPSDDSVYILGSHSREHDIGIRNVIYSLQTQRLSIISRMQHNRAGFGSAIVGDTVYVSGGIDPYPDPYNERGYSRSPDESVLRSTERYSPSCGWQTVSPMTKARKNFSLLTYNQRLYAIGGTTDISDLVEIYDPAVDKWTLVGGSLSGQYDFIGAVAVSDVKKSSGQ